MAEPFRVGIVGAVSSYTLHYAHALNDMPGIEFGGLAHLGRDPKYIRDALNLPWLGAYPKTLEGYAERFGGGLYEQPEELVDDARLDAVCICTEDYLHQHHALRAIDKGMHVFLPKPFAKSREEAETVFEAANAAGVVAVGNLPHRFSLSITTYAGDRNTDVDSRSHPGVEEIRFQVDLTVGDRDNVGRNVRRNVTRLRFDDGERRQ